MLLLYDTGQNSRHTDAIAIASFDNQAITNEVHGRTRVMEHSIDTGADC
jgi:hypothetical protein